MTRCTGQCCEQFVLSSGGHGIDMDQLRADPLRWKDGLIVLYMLIPLGEGRFNCKHFDRGTRDCTIYERRPQMCRDYPYGRACPRDGCTLEGPESSQAIVPGPHAGAGSSSSSS